MVSLPNRGSGPRSSRRLSSTSPWTYSARKILGMVEGLSFAIEALEAAPTYFSQILQSLTDRNSSACQCVLDALTKAKKSNVRRYNHQCLTELDEQDLAPLRELVQFAVPRRDCNAPLITYADRFNWSSCRTGHDKRFSFVNISGTRVARAHVPCKWISSA